MKMKLVVGLVVAVRLVVVRDGCGRRRRSAPAHVCLCYGHMSRVRVCVQFTFPKYYVTCSLSDP